MEHYVITGASAANPEICRALGLDPNRVRRIVLDFDAENPGPLIAYVEMIADERFLSIKWELGDGVQIKYADTDSDKTQEQ